MGASLSRDWYRSWYRVRIKYNSHQRGDGLAVRGSRIDPAGGGGRWIGLGLLLLDFFFLVVELPVVVVGFLVDFFLVVLPVAAAFGEFLRFGGGGKSFVVSVDFLPVVGGGGGGVGGGGGSLGLLEALVGSWRLRFVALLLLPVSAGSPS
jgi:hypothetical protein